MIQNIKINLSKNNKNINYKSYFYSGLLSIILIDVPNPDSSL